MSVSVSQIGTDRSLDRSIDQSRLPGQSLDQFICVCRCLYKEQHPPNTRSHFRRKILHPADLFYYLFVSYPRRSRAPVSPVHDDEVAKSLPFPAIAPREDRCTKVTRLVLSIMAACAKFLRTNPRGRPSDSRKNSRGCRRYVGIRDRKHCCAHAEEHDGEKTPGKRNEKRRTMHRRPSWVPRMKLTRYVNRLSTPCGPVYIYRYINILYVHTHICARVYVCVRACASAWYVRMYARMSKA